MLLRKQVSEIAQQEEKLLGSCCAMPSPSNWNGLGTEMVGTWDANIPRMVNCLVGKGGVWVRLSEPCCAPAMAASCSLSPSSERCQESVSWSKSPVVFFLSGLVGNRGVGYVGRWSEGKCWKTMRSYMLLFVVLLPCCALVCG